jgi:RimJ/RimL family protein N-acetyltransferase
MNIENEGLITFNNKNYKYKFFDINGLIDIIRHKIKLKESLEEAIRKYRNMPNFKILDILKEYIYYRPDSITYYFITHKNNKIITTSRLYYYPEKEYGYINMVYTNEEYRGKGICKEGIKYLINKTKEYIKTYELEVIVDNIAALKCYEYNGFKIKKKKKYTRIHDDNKKEIIDYYLMKLVL